MKSSILLFATLTVCFRLVFSLDCTNAPGISFIPCKIPSASSTGGSGGAGAASSQDNTIVVESCTDIEYNGKQAQKYTVTNQEVPQVFELLFETLNIPDGEKLLIKTLKCDPNNDCKIAVIDSTATTPFSVYINKYSFTLASPSSTVSATFKVNFNCASSPAINGDWSSWGPWGSCNSDCEQERTRECNNPPPSNGGQDCSGQSSQIQGCAGDSCPPAINGAWSEWGPWSSCNSDCKQERTRECNKPPPSNGGQDCSGSGTQIQDCTGDLCVGPQGCDGFDTEAGSKMLKILDQSRNFQQCFDICETQESRMLKTISVAEYQSLPSHQLSFWLGLKQNSLNTYIWNDGESFTVTIENGNIPNYGSLHPWYTMYDNGYSRNWDNGTYDNNDCLATGFYGWLEHHCEDQIACACECTLS